MNESAKKGLLISVIVVAVATAGFFAWRSFGEDKPVVVKRIEGDPAKSMKRMEMEAQKSGAPRPSERNLAGDLQSN